MGFEPDILVTSSDGSSVWLVIETKLRLARWQDAEAQLKRYMIGMSCPVGLVVTPQSIRMYRNTFSGSGPDSIEQVGEFPAPPRWQSTQSIGAGQPGGADPAQEAFRFEAMVQSWIEQLATDAARDELPVDLRRAVDEHVLPMLMKGEVRAAGPRWQRSYKAS